MAQVQKESANKLLTCLLITANVGTIFEESHLQELWFKELKSHLSEGKPQFVAIHCQEIGGKNYSSSIKYLSKFTDKIVHDDEIVGSYNRVRIFLDENYECLEKFTALGSIYLIRDSVEDVRLYNFRTTSFDPIQRGCLLISYKTATDAPDNVEKIKFPQHLFPESRWSRKGFMRTRWLFEDSKNPVDLVNIHLFHDASNLVAMKQTPSPYAKDRQRALEFTLRKLSEPLRVSETDILNNDVPLFIFGDFNFRLDTNKVIEKITEGVLPEIRKSTTTDEVVEFVYRGKEAAELGNISTSSTSAISDTGEKQSTSDNQPTSKKVVMTIGKKLFDYDELDEASKVAKNSEWLHQMDNELSSFKEKLLEFTVSFNPSYPFKEDTTGAHSYMKTRCPSWCDRILFNPAGCKLIHCSQKPEQTDSERRIELLQSLGDVQYNLMGISAPMGDHKPVLLSCKFEL